MWYMCNGNKIKYYYAHQPQPHVRRYRQPKILKQQTAKAESSLFHSFSSTVSVPSGFVVTVFSRVYMRGFLPSR